MRIFQGCRCGNCLSIMFPFYFDIFNTSIRFVCPRGCTWGEVVGIFNKIPIEFINKWQINFSPGNAIYRNFCWNCYSEIISEMVNGTKAKRDTIWSLGFVCQNCQESLRGLMVKKGVITTTKVFIPSNPVYVGNLIT